MNRAAIQNALCLAVWCAMGAGSAAALLLVALGGATA